MKEEVILQDAKEKITDRENASLRENADVLVLVLGKDDAKIVASIVLLVHIRAVVPEQTVILPVVGNPVAAHPFINLLHNHMLEKME